MDKEEICQYFNSIIKNEKDVSAGMAAIRTLLKVLKHSKSETVQELRICLQHAIDAMRSTETPVTAIASGSELFLRFITLATLDTASIAECKGIMLERGKVFYEKLVAARGKVAKVAAHFITDGSIILTHSKSRVVLQAMKEAAASNKIFEVYVTSTSPDNNGEEMCQSLTKLGISCTVILDSAVGYVMEHIDMVMVGAEGVAESGGVINKIGTYTMAICAKEVKKPFYVLTESFKFSRIYPLNQVDLPNEFKYTYSVLLTKNLKKEHPLVDYTPPHYISLLFTDLGILTPSAVSDELIKLYL
ncbi:PREDICTED: translation initiation factor eIF-2B subunit alpha isoform X1 [Trachymyrmex cornetzi]|nr:PREDICTED: translation initiation factor eIF-2B subunit alpha isoform X1 [Trachymyrmex cornetzi]XP_018366754.1 PREDICTED: translation initiation factor eIF-2B subunit alpha isoform X1 [Trachymyrmex cornetzi]XP_018366755.1 PREDICTED: translation initiation factor eIF-2B subunit alpha isoform X1 [Trachymyrmex cornetzi]